MTNLTKPHPESRFWNRMAPGYARSTISDVENYERKLRETAALMRPDMQVLEIGCGSGYQAAILSKICRRVFTIERIDELLKEAKSRFSALKMHNIITRFDEGKRGLKKYAPFESILFSAIVKEIPSVLFEQLVEGGICVAPLLETEDYQSR